EEVEMEVRHGLARTFFAINNDSVAIVQAELVRKLDRDEMEMAKQVAIQVGEVRMRRDDLAWDDENMRRRLRIVVAESQAPFIFMDNGRGDLPVEDFLEDVIF